jgi:predicted dienelactone hydrolase
VVTTRTVRSSLFAALVAALLLVAGCASDGKAAAPTPTEQGTKATAGASSTTTTVDPGLPTEPAADYGVGSRTLHLVDPSRPTAASPSRKIVAQDSRTLEVLVLYPSSAPASTGEEVADAPVADGRFPIVEFSHGVTASGPAYTGFLQPLARAGYVVVAPTFPLTSGAGGWTDLKDYGNQPADVSFVLDQVLALDEKAGDPLQHHLASDAVAVAGHSLGAITTFGFVNSCCPDPRVKAIIEISGVELPFDRGTFDDPPKVPALLIHGQVDGTVPYRGSSQAFENLAGPRALLSFPKAGHVDPVAGKEYTPVTEATVKAFLALELRDDDTAWTALPATTAVGGIQVAGGLAAPGGAPTS